jgi:hypothetical protein
MSITYEASRLRRGLESPREAPADWASRSPMIEVVTVCPRCEGDFYDRERKPGGTAVGRVGFGSVTNCNACSYGHNVFLVPLDEAISKLNPARRWWRWCKAAWSNTFNPAG